MADTIKCPACSGNLLFDAESQKLVCEFCGSSFLPGEFKNDEVSNQLTEEKAAEDSIIEVSPDNSNADTHKANMQEIVCNSCGASLLTDKNTSATFCSFCGSPALSVQNLTKEFKPKYIIPFTISKGKAKEGFLKWCKGGRLAPFGFASDKNIEKMIGLYVPFWLFDAKARMNRVFEATTKETKTSGDQQITTTRYYDLIRVGNFAWEHVPLDGETKIDAALMEAIEPYDFSKMVDYDYTYIPGFYADAYDLKADDLTKRAEDRFKKYLEEEFTSTIGKYKTVKKKTDRSSLQGMRVDYALLPVWFLNYKYEGQDFTFVMNGQTGEVAGVPPVSKLKKILIYFACLAVFTLIIKIIVGLALGGYVG